MLAHLSWKNVWRNKKRSLIIVLAIAFGLWGGLFSASLFMGMTESMVDSAIDRYLGHVEIHNPRYNKDAQIFYNIENSDRVNAALKNAIGISAWTMRTIAEGMASSPASSYGVKVVGIDTASEKKVTRLQDKIIEGDYLLSKKRNPVLVGKKLAERLSLKLHQKIILTYQGMNGEIVYLAGRISGIFKTESSVFDESHVFLKKADLLKSLGNPGNLVHEIAIRCTSVQELDNVRQDLAHALPTLSVQEWRTVAPDLAFYANSILPFTYLFVTIILFALLFGITNNMLMSVMERIRELGILTAVGMKKSRIFMMILMETIMLSVTGGFSGMVLGGLTIAYFNSHGFNLSAFATGLQSFGSGSILYPYLPGDIYIGMTVMIVVAASLASFMPARKATTLVPAQAIRTY